MTDQPVSPVYTRPKLDAIDPRKMKLREIAAVEAVIGRPVSGELESGALHVDVMTAFLWVALCRQAGVRISAAERTPEAMALWEQAGEYDLQEIEQLFKDEDEGPPPLPPGTPDPTPATQSGGDTSDAWPEGGTWNATPDSSTSGV